MEHVWSQHSHVCYYCCYQWQTWICTITTPCWCWITRQDTNDIWARIMVIHDVRCGVDCHFWWISWLGNLDGLVITVNWPILAVAVWQLLEAGYVTFISTGKYKRMNVIAARYSHVTYSLKFLPDVFDQDAVYIRSTDYPRTQESVQQLVAAGLYPSDKRPEDFSLQIRTR